MYGMLNNIMRAFGMTPVAFLYNKSTVIPALAVMQIWMSGNTMVIYLAGLKGIPKQLYEAVEIDGGNSLHRLIHITIPMMSPIIFYNIIMTIITCMQTFAQAYIMTEGGRTMPACSIVATCTEWLLEISRWDMRQRCHGFCS